MGRYRNGRLANVLGIVYLFVIMIVALTAIPLDDPHERGPELSAEIDIGLHVLDHQILDSEGRRCGNVDDLEIEGGAGRDAAGRRDPRRPGVLAASAPGCVGRLAGWIGGGGRVRVPGRRSPSVDSAVAAAQDRRRSSASAAATTAFGPWIEQDSRERTGENAVVDPAPQGRDRVRRVARPLYDLRGDASRLGRCGHRDWSSAGAACSSTSASCAAAQPQIPWGDVVRIEGKRIVVRDR